MKLPDVYAVQHVGDRWLMISPSSQTFARTFDRAELTDVAQVPCPCPEKPAQSVNSELMV
jgi:hypothetical protein